MYERVRLAITDLHACTRSRGQSILAIVTHSSRSALQKSVDIIDYYGWTGAAQVNGKTPEPCIGSCLAATGSLMSRLAAETPGNSKLLGHISRY